MSNNIIITSIHITNFRSIRNITIMPTKLNIFVGLNDVGKSNVIKALNLFFNNNTDYDMEFDFTKDFSYLFPEKSHSAKEIKIELRLQIPDSFKNSGSYTWTKVWRREGLSKDFIVDEFGNSPTERSRIPNTLHRIKFRYVPAVKSKEFYKFLLSELYLTAASSLNSPLVESTKEFAGVIQRYTEQIHNEVNEKIGIGSKLTVPSDMTDMFRTLVFITKGANEAVSIPLDMRGDGIQSRHIPIILKYLADEDQKTRNQGSAKITSVWGYEEPENGIELLKAFEVSESFHDYCKEIQVFITTHSPAFYQQEHNEDTKVFYVKKNDDNETSIHESIGDKEVGRSMGLMPLVAPYIATMERKINELKRIANDMVLVDVPTVFVEGVTDKKYLEMAIGIYSPKLKSMIESESFRIFSDANRGGCKQVTSWILAWIYKGNNSKTLALFDKDDAGILAYNELVSNSAYLESRNNKAAYINPSDAIIGILKKDVIIRYEIEHLLSVNCLTELNARGYLEDRSSSEINSMLGKHSNKDKSATQIFRDLFSNYDEIKNILLCKAKDDAKMSIVEFIQKSSQVVRKEYLIGLKKTVESIEKRFCE